MQQLSNVFIQCEEGKEFKVTKLKGIVLDCSGTEKRGLQTAIGQEAAKTLD